MKRGRRPALLAGRRHGMVDFFLLLMMAGAGDEVQSVKMGVFELADLFAVNKDDGANADPAEQATAEFRRALHLMEPVNSDWTLPVVTCSGRYGDGLDDRWAHVEDHRQTVTGSGELEASRGRQHSDPEIAERQRELESAGEKGSIAPSVAG